MTTRRAFLKRLAATGGLVATGPSVPEFLLRAAHANSNQAGSGETVFVAIQLAGGNDGLNTVVPFKDDLYHSSRPTLALSARAVLRLNGQLGFHPQMQALRTVFDQGHLAIVQGVGHPHAEQGHHGAMQIWQTGRLDWADCQTGWLGRAVDAGCRAGEEPPGSVFVGQTPRAFALASRRTVIPVVRSVDDCRLLRSAPSKVRLSNQVDTAPLRAALRAQEAAESLSREISTASQVHRDYPASALGRNLRLVADLIRTNAGLRIFVTELGGVEPGGFDTHAGQAPNHAALVEQLSAALAAFARDLAADRLFDRVLVMTYSEFGRTVKENGRRGTDHGAAAPVFLLGGKVRGGVVGPHPSLAEFERGGVKYHTDFRRLYATVLERWLRIDSRPILGEKFQTLDVVTVG